MRYKNIYITQKFKFNLLFDYIVKRKDVEALLHELSFKYNANYNANKTKQFVIAKL